MNYHEKALCDITAARHFNSAVGNPNNDEGLYDIAAYHAQQAIEKELKYILHDIFGADDTLRKFKTHFIPDLVSQVEEYNFSVPDDVKDIAYDITEWEASTRYPGGGTSDRNEIAEAIHVFENLAKYVEDVVENKELEKGKE